MEIIRTPDTSNECALVNVLYRLIEHCDKEAGLDTFPKFKELINTTYDRPGRRTVPQTLNEYRNSQKMKNTKEFSQTCLSDFELLFITATENCLAGETRDGR